MLSRLFFTSNSGGRANLFFRSGTWFFLVQSSFLDVADRNPSVSYSGPPIGNCTGKAFNPSFLKSFSVAALSWKWPVTQISLFLISVFSFAADKRDTRGTTETKETKRIGKQAKQENYDWDFSLTWQLLVEGSFHNFYLQWAGVEIGRFWKSSTKNKIQNQICLFLMQ